MTVSITQNAVMLTVTKSQISHTECRYVEYIYAECRYAEYPNAEYPYAECRGALPTLSSQV